MGVVVATGTGEAFPVLLGGTVGTGFADPIGTGVAFPVLVGTGLAIGTGVPVTVDRGVGEADADGSAGAVVPVAVPLAVAVAVGVAGALADCDVVDDAEPLPAEAVPEHPVSASPAAIPSAVPITTSGVF